MVSSMDIPAALLVNAVVYGWRRGTTEWLYIGSCHGLLQRLQTHGLVGRDEEVGAKDWIVVWELVDRKAALALEKRLIKEHAPKYNVYGTGNRRGQVKGGKWKPEVNRNHQWECLRCNAKWHPRKYRTDPEGFVRRPAVCPVCRSANWDRPYQYKVEKVVR